MKRINKALSVLLCLVMALSCCAFSAFAEDVTTPEQAACEHELKIAVVPPTCAERGYTQHVCQKCGYHYEDTYVNPTGHSYGQWREIKEATCTSEGLMERECIHCHGKETKTVSVLPHVDENEDGKCDACGAKMEIKQIFSPFEWLKSFIQFLKDLINSIFA